MSLKFVVIPELHHVIKELLDAQQASEVAFWRKKFEGLQLSLYEAVNHLDDGKTVDLHFDRKRITITKV